MQQCVETQSEKPLADDLLIYRLFWVSTLDEFYAFLQFGRQWNSHNNLHFHPIDSIFVTDTHKYIWNTHNKLEDPQLLDLLVVGGFPIPTPKTLKIRDFFNNWK